MVVSERICCGDWQLLLSDSSNDFFGVFGQVDPDGLLNGADGNDGFTFCAEAWSVRMVQFHQNECGWILEVNDPC